MAAPLEFEPHAVPTDPSARAELERLLETCQTRGLLRFANDLIGAGPGVAGVLVESLSGPGAQNALKNLAVLLMALSRIPPEQFYRLCFALQEAIATLASASPAASARGEAPGVTGALRLLQDERLWRDIWPLFNALHAFSERLHRPIDNPISDFSGKQGRTQ